VNNGNEAHQEPAKVHQPTLSIAKDKRIVFETLIPFLKKYRTAEKTLLHPIPLM
jgi:hypothetical protein